MQKTIEFAEFTGIVLGDGHIHTTENKITIVGSLEDFEYLNSHVRELICQLFGLNPTIKRRNDRNAYYLYFHSKDSIASMMEMGLKRGNKSNAAIPPFVQSQNMACHFLRGLFDTDGCLKFSKQGSDKNHYPRIQFCFQLSPLGTEIKALLKSLDFKVSSWVENRGNGLIYHQVSGVHQLESFMGYIGSKNQVHATKYLFWKKFGHVVPKSSLQARKQALNLKSFY